MVNKYYIITQSLKEPRKIGGPYTSIVKARAAAIRAIKNGKYTYRTDAGYPSVSVSTSKEFNALGGFHPQVVLIDGEFRWNTWDFGNMSNMPVLNTDGTIKRRRA